MHGTSAILFQLEHVSKSYPLERGVLPVLTDLNLELYADQWSAVVGRSGSGKSTLLQLLGALDRPTGGSILYQGQNLCKMKSSALTALRRREFGFVFQSYHLLAELTALENAALPALNWNSNRQEAYDRARMLLCQFGLAERLGHHPAELSGGEQQRVAIARALINNPPVILADEPTGNLDKASGEMVIDILKTLRKKEHKSIIMVTHDMILAKQCDQLIEFVNVQK